MTFKAAPLSAAYTAEGIGGSMSERRHRDFLRACRRVVSEQRGGSPLRIREIAEIAAGRPAPEYYVSYEYALRMVYRVNARGSSGVKGPMENCWQEIARKVRKCVARSNGRLNISDALSRVLAEGGASSFFLTPATAKRLYHHALRRKAVCSQ